MNKKGKQIQPRVGAEKAFGLVVRQVRNEKRMSQEELAWESGLDRTTVSMLERGLMSPTLRTIVRLSTALNLLASSLVARAEKSSLFK